MWVKTCFLLALFSIFNPCQAGPKHYLVETKDSGNWFNTVCLAPIKNYAEDISGLFWYLLFWIWRAVFTPQQGLNNWYGNFNNLMIQMENCILGHIY